jgi:NCAIR mutase (PurE)-related protein
LATAAELAGAAADSDVHTAGPTSSLEAVSLDLDRARRCGFPEVIYGEGKPAETIAEIAARLLAAGQRVLATRITPSQAEVVTQRFPQSRYNPVARTVRIDPEQGPGKQSPDQTDLGQRGQVAIIAAGTSDRPVAEEAAETLDWMGVSVTMIHDVGVAGPHRLPERLAEFASADAIVVVAGMEGALPSIVGGYVACPVFAVPTRVGYGASLGGIAALLSMLNSCAANVAVVNIDAGFKAGYLAGLVAAKIAESGKQRAEK